MVLDCCVVLSEGLEDHATKYGVSLRDSIRNTAIHRRTKVIDIAVKICVRRTDNLWERKDLRRRPRTERLSVRRPPTRWTDDIVR